MEIDCAGSIASQTQRCPTDATDYNVIRRVPLGSVMQRIQTFGSRICTEIAPTKYSTMQVNGSSNKQQKKNLILLQILKLLQKCWAHVAYFISYTRVSGHPMLFSRMSDNLVSV